MTIEDRIYSTLTGHAGLSALISTRVYPVDLPQGATLPAVTYMQVSGPRHHTFRSDVAVEPRYQFTGWAETAKDARAVRDQVEVAIQTLADGSGVNVHSVTVEGGFEDKEPETQRYCAHIDAIVLWSAA